MSGDQYIRGDATAGPNDVQGPASAVDNAIALFDGTTGKLIKESTATINGTDMNVKVPIFVEQLVEGGDLNIKIENEAPSGSTDETMSFLFRSGSNRSTGRIVIGRDGDYSGAARLSNMQFHTAGPTSNLDAEKMRITSAGDIGFGKTVPLSTADVGGTMGWNRTATAVSVNTSDDSVIYGVTSTAAPRTITLDTDDVVANRIIIVKDESGAAGTNNITIATEGAETIDGAATIVISVNFGVVRLYSNGTNWFTF